MNSTELANIMKRLGLKKVEVTPTIFALCSEINKLDKALIELGKQMDKPAEIKKED